MAQPLIHLLIQYCNTDLAPRQMEFDYCLRRNFANPWIASIHNLVEPATIVPDEFRNHPKYIEHPLGHWLTYSDALAYASEKLTGQSVCLANLDIFLDDEKTDWANAGIIIDKNIVLCLSRLEFDGKDGIYADPGLSVRGFANSQDVWIFRPPFTAPDCDFELGTLGCDNAFAERVHRSGRIPVNAASRFHIYHYDQCRGKTFKNQAEIHKKSGRKTRRPEEQGHYFLPDFDRVKSVDTILSAVKVTEIQRYLIICDVLNKLFDTGNP